MIQLPNGCRCSELAIFPKNWNTKNADLSLTWFIKYRFYSPGEKPKQIVIKGLAKDRTLEERRRSVRDIIADELKALKDGYNPVLKTMPGEQPQDRTRFIECLKRAAESKKCGIRQKQELKSILPFVTKSIHRLAINLPISQISRKHIRAILDDLPNIKAWSDNQFNHYRKNLSILFEEMIEQELVESNPVKMIRKLPTSVKKKRLLTDKQCVKVDDYLKENYPDFRRFVILFFHSGSRISELMRLTRKDVDLKNQTFTLWIRKGKGPVREVEKPIHNNALPYWKQLMKMPGNYLFSKGLRPGATPINPAQVSRRWRNHIKDKKKLGIDIDFYALKHLYLDKLSELKEMKAAQALAGHTSEKTTMIYAVNESKRRNEQLKSVPITFGSN